MSGRLMVNLIVILDIRAQAVADTRTKSDSNLGRKGQAVADTRINRLTRWLTDSVNHLFCEENMENSRDYRNPNYTEKIKLQRFFYSVTNCGFFF